MTFAFGKHRASVITGALFCLGLCFASTSCGEENPTPDWSQSDRQSDIELVQVDASEPPIKPQDSSGRGFSLMSYNVQNWLSLDAKARDRGYQASEKSEEAKQAVIHMMLKHKPDIIGLSEIGTAGDLADIQERLKKGGLNLPHSHYAGGSDLVRRLGLLSKYPITKTNKPDDLDFRIKGKTYGMNRGVLDTTLRIDGQSYRLLGVHLKSKRKVRGVDQESIRIHEARLLRKHFESILDKNPEDKVIVYGDFNDTRPSVAFKTIVGSYGTDDYLTAIPFKDSNDHAWTHHWSMHDIYSRIDFVLVSQSMRKRTDFKKSYIVDHPSWDEASDHRPLMALFR